MTGSNTLRLLVLVPALLALLGVEGCTRTGGGEIIRLSRQNNSGTYEYFRETVLGKMEYKFGSIDAQGSKDLVKMVGQTPCAIGYSGMGYKTPEVKFLKVKKGDGPAVPPSVEAVHDHAYPISRPLYMYTLGEPVGAVKDYLDWIRSDAGQKVLGDIGYVPLPAEERFKGTVSPAAVEGSKKTVQNKGSDTMIEIAQAWSEAYKAASVEVSGGGSGVGISALISGTVDIANCSRHMTESEMKEAKTKTGKDPVQHVVGYDALAVYVHKDNPLEEISMEQLAQIYGVNGNLTKWSQLGVSFQGRK
jgi:ABC-type phosphate transport system substrate-binding protein